MPAPTRREFLKAAIVTTAAITAAAQAFAAARAPASVALYAVIPDARFAASRAFAAEAQRRGTPVKAIRGEVHDLWHDDLSHHWNDRPMALAGMTTHDALFLLAMMGRDAGMRVVYRAHHTLGLKDEKAQHMAFGPHDVLARQPALEGREESWGRTAAQIVTAWPKTAAALRPSRSTIGLADHHAIAPDALLTWLMVPRALLA